MPEFDKPEREPVFQSWHAFDPAAKRWRQIEQRGPRSSSSRGGDKEATLSVVTWNVDAFTRLSDARMQGVLDEFKALDPAPDIIFLQEVCRRGLATVLDDLWIRESWFSSEGHGGSFHWNSFMTMTLLSKVRFAADDGISLGPVGAVWRIEFPSRFQRDALCCDVFLPTPLQPPSSAEAPSTSGANPPEYVGATPARVRLVNVHLDSLKTNPSMRPEQLAIVSSLLSSAGRGLVAGDFNPIQPEDATIVETNGLVDAWVDVHGSDPGHTWGIDGRGAPFPATRMDKVALLGLQAQKIQVMHPGIVMEEPSPRGEDNGDDEPVTPLHWSDHSGLRCFFSLP